MVLENRTGGEVTPVHRVEVQGRANSRTFLRLGSLLSTVQSMSEERFQGEKEDSARNLVKQNDALPKTVSPQRFLADPWPVFNMYLG